MYACPVEIVSLTLVCFALALGLHHLENLATCVDGSSRAAHEGSYFFPGNEVVPWDRPRYINSIEQKSFVVSMMSDIPTLPRCLCQLTNGLSSFSIMAPTYYWDKNSLREKIIINGKNDVTSFTWQERSTWIRCLEYWVIDDDLCATLPARTTTTMRLLRYCCCSTCIWDSSIERCSATYCAACWWWRAHCGWCSAAGLISGFDGLRYLI